MIQLRTKKGLLAPSSNGRYEIEEASPVWISGATSATREGRELHRDSDGRLTADLSMVVGRTWLVCDAGGQSHIIEIEVLPSTKKVTRDLWARILDDLEHWMPGVTAGIGDTREGSVGSRGVTAEFLAEALIPLVPEFLEAVRSLCERLRRRRTTTLLDMPTHAARRVRTETVRWLARHGDVARRLLRGAEVSQRPDRLPLRMPTEDFEHPANRYIAWLLRTVQKVMIDVAERLKSRHKRDDESTAWFEHRAMRMAAASTAVGRLIRDSPLASVRPDPDVSGAMTSVVDDPAYARVYRLGRLFINPAFELERDAATPMGARPSYGIYEIWCLLSLIRGLQGLPGFTWTFERMDRLLKLGSSGGGAIAIGKSSAGVLELRFNATFGSYHSRLATNASFQRWSISSERRPDFSIAWLPANGSARWVVLDAKYQSHEQGLAGSMESLHFYRDALRWDNCNGAPVGGMLLAPRCHDAEAYFAKDYLVQFRIGVMQACPGADQTPIVEWLTDRLDIPSGRSGENLADQAIYAGAADSDEAKREFLRDFEAQR